MSDIINTDTNLSDILKVEDVTIIEDNTKVLDDKEVVSVKNKNGLNICKSTDSCNTRKVYDRFNYSKLKVLECCIKLQSDGLVINTNRVAAILKKPKSTTASTLHRMSAIYPYLKRKLDPNATDGCMIMYELDKEGLSVYQKLKERFDKGLDLNLKKKNPEKVKFLDRKSGLLFEFVNDKEEKKDDSTQ